MAVIEGLSQAQTNFVRSLRRTFHDELVSPGRREKQPAAGPSARTLHRWLTADEDFREHYFGACEALRDQIDSALLQCGVRAAAKLARSLEDPDAIRDDTERRTLIDLVRAARAVLAKDPTEKERKCFARKQERRHSLWPIHPSLWDKPETIKEIAEILSRPYVPGKENKEANGNGAGPGLPEE